MIILKMNLSVDEKEEFCIIILRKDFNKKRSNAQQATTMR